MADEALGWHADPSRRHRIRYRDESGWTAWVADDATALLDPRGAEGIDAEVVTPRPDWYGDPSGAYRFRWWDGDRWTSRVVGHGPRIRAAPASPAWAPPSRAEVTERTLRTRRTWRMALVGTAIVVGIVALPLAAYVLNEAANDYNEAVVGDGASQLMLAMEMNTWQLPPSVQPYSGSLFDRSHGKSVTRFYEPVAGVAVEQAAEDLVSALRRQGYNDLESTAPIEWAGSCSTTGDCRMRIEADGERARIVVALAA